MIRKIAAVLVMVVSVVGFLLCLTVVIGAWVVNEPATEAITNALDVVDGYLSLAEETIAQVDTRLVEVESKVETISDVTPERAAELQGRIEQEIVPVITQVDEVLTGLQSGIATVNKTLTQINRVPGIDLPDAEELANLDERIVALDNGLTEVTTALAANELDGEKIIAATSAISSSIAELRNSMATWSTRIGQLRDSVASVKSTTPSLIDRISLILSLLFVLLGAGQVALFMAGLNWFRTKESIA